MTDPIFLLRCIDCDARGLLSRLWLRASVDAAYAPRTEQHYVECMNCGARLKSCRDDVMETVDDEEWARIVSDDAGISSARSEAR